MDDFEIGLCWGTIYRAGLVDMIELAGRHGFPTLAVPPHIYEAALAAGETGNSLRRRLADAEVRVQVIDCIAAGMPGMTSSEMTFSGWRIRQYSAEECIAIADELEAPILNVSLYGSRSIPTAEMGEAVGAVCRQAGRARTVVLEFFPESGINSLAEAHTIAQASGEANCAVMFDFWHFMRSGGSVAEIAALPPGAIGSVQISDRSEPPPGAAYVPMSGRKLPGEGELPLWALADAVLANSPGITFELEVFSDELRDLSLDYAAARAAAAVRLWRSSRPV